MVELNQLAGRENGELGRQEEEKKVDADEKQTEGPVSAPSSSPTTPDRDQDGARESATASTYQVVAPTPPTPDFLVDEKGYVIPTALAGEPAPSTLNASQREQLDSLGVDVEAVESATRQQPGSPVIVVVNQQPQSSAAEMSQSVAPAPRRPNRGLQQMLGQVKEALTKVGQTLGRAFDSLKQPFQNRNARRQDLNNLAAAASAQRLLQNFGQQQQDGSLTFEGQAYRYQQQGEHLTVTAKDGRGTILELGNGQLQGNLSRGDRHSFRTLDRQLNKVIRSSEFGIRKESKKTEITL